MNTNYADRGVVSLHSQDYDLGVLRASTHDYAILEELCFVRREAQAEANLAYDDWTSSSMSEAYTVFRAAQDRADAAQDDVASWSARLAAALA